MRIPPSLLLLALLALAASPVRAEDHLGRSIRLKGERTFAGILREAEDQLGIRFQLPQPADDATTRAYDQTVTLADLLGAMESYYARAGLTVAWRVTGDTVQVRRTGAAPAAEAEAEAEDPAPRPEPKPRPKPAPRPTGPAIVAPAEELPEAIPARPEEAPPTRPPAAEKPASTLRVTAYPDNAIEFINDAPSIMPSGGPEVYVEWETRMRGALLQGNRRLLQKEREELERRQKWLDQNLK